MTTPNHASYLSLPATTGNEFLRPIRRTDIVHHRSIHETNDRDIHMVGGRYEGPVLSDTVTTPEIRDPRNEHSPCGYGSAAPNPAKTTGLIEATLRRAPRCRHRPLHVGASATTVRSTRPETT